MYKMSKTSRDLNLGLKCVPVRNLCGFSILQCYMVLRTAAQLPEWRMGGPMRNAATCLLFNLPMREIGESHCRNTNVVTEEYCCVMWWTIQGELRSFHITEIVHFISAHKDLCSLLCSYCVYWIINCLLYTYICTNKYCKFILIPATCFGVNTPSSGSIQVVLAKVTNQ